MTAVSVRPSRPDEVAAIHAIYAHHVAHSLWTLELVPPSAEDMARRREDVLARGMPHLVAVRGGEVVGWAAAAPYRLRGGFAHTVEDAVYVAPGHQRQGIGRLLLEGVIEACTQADFRQMVAVIGNAGNAASIALHAGLGFERVGLLPAIGHKSGRWLDCVLMQRRLGTGDATPPSRQP